MKDFDTAPDGADRRGRFSDHASHWEASGTSHPPAGTQRTLSRWMRWHL